MAIRLFVHIPVILIYLPSFRFPWLYDEVFWHCRCWHCLSVLHSVSLRLALHCRCSRWYCLYSLVVCRLSVDVPWSSLSVRLWSILASFICSWTMSSMFMTFGIRCIFFVWGHLLGADAEVFRSFPVFHSFPFLRQVSSSSLCLTCLTCLLVCLWNPSLTSSTTSWGRFLSMFTRIRVLHFSSFLMLTFLFFRFSGPVDFIFDVVFVSCIFDVFFIVQIFKFSVMQFIISFRGPVGHPFFRSGAFLSAFGLRRQLTRPPGRCFGFRCAMCPMRAALIGRSAPCAVGPSCVVT